jgi:hypothetical protein
MVRGCPKGKRRVSGAKVEVSVPVDIDEVCYRRLCPGTAAVLHQQGPLPQKLPIVLI